MSFCETCGIDHPGQCPRIKAIEYHENGTIKRIEYFEERPQVKFELPPLTAGPILDRSPL